MKQIALDGQDLRRKPLAHQTLKSVIIITIIIIIVIVIIIIILISTMIINIKAPVGRRWQASHSVWRRGPRDDRRGRRAAPTCVHPRHRQSGVAQKEYYMHHPQWLPGGQVPAHSHREPLLLFCLTSVMCHANIYLKIPVRCAPVFLLLQNLSHAF